MVGSAGRNIVFFIALFATALALGAAMAHALELANKIGLSREDYFVVQRIYAGWSRLGYLLAIQLAAMVAVAILYRRRLQVLWPTLVAIGCLLAAQAVFWAFTFPANQATVNWTVQPDDWQALRRQWEYSHLAGAGLQALAMASLIVAALARADDPG
jgi:hypothetical protein